MSWVAALLVVAGLAIASALVGGTLRVRLSWVDPAVVVLIVLVATSASHAQDRRPAINLSWEWIAFGVAYLLVRNLPRTRGESSALAGALVATAVAVSAYGMFQVGVEQEELRQYYASHPVEALRAAGITPGTPAQKLFEDRVLGSNEVYSTFGLANSLAGFLLGPLILLVAVGWDNLQNREGRGSRARALALAAPLGALLLTCLLLTKSRSASLGLAAALAILAWRERRRVSAGRLAWGAIAGLVAVSALVAAGVATGRLDRQVLTETPKSLGYRAEYWIGAWGVITEGPRTWLTGHGPGNFSGPYVRHKLARASEEILDPHNLVLEVWAASGVVASLALVAALGLALRETLGPARTPTRRPAPEPRKGRHFSAETEIAAEPESAAAPKRVGWLVAFAGGGWVVASLVGTLDPFAGDLYRWIILGGAWAGAVALGLPLWRRRPIVASGLGLAVLGVAINLLAAGGIGIPAVALALWTAMALGLNLREDRGCGRLRVAGGRLPAFVLAIGWAALIGVFVRTVLPYWQVDAAMAEVELAMTSRPADPVRAELAMERAIRADRFSARPWVALAEIQYVAWRARGAKVDDLRWRTVPVALLEAVSPPRNPSWSLHRRRASRTRDLLEQLGPALGPIELLRLRADVVHATRTASRLYPTHATLHAELAEASADIGMIPDAVREAREALRLDGITPHQDKKLPDAVRKGLEARLPAWEKSAPADPSPAP